MYLPDHEFLGLSKDKVGKSGKTTEMKCRRYIYSDLFGTPYSFHVSRDQQDRWGRLTSVHLYIHFGRTYKIRFVLGIDLNKRTHWDPLRYTSSSWCSLFGSVTGLHTLCLQLKIGWFKTHPKCIVIRLEI